MATRLRRETGALGGRSLGLKPRASARHHQVEVLPSQPAQPARNTVQLVRPTMRQVFCQQRRLRVAVLLDQPAVQSAGDVLAEYLRGDKRKARPIVEARRQPGLEIRLSSSMTSMFRTIWLRSTSYWTEV